MTSLAIAGISTCADVEISPMIMTRPVVVTVSQATLPIGSFSRIASSTASEIWSQILSGWPSVTDSDVKKRFILNLRSVFRFSRDFRLVFGGL